MITSTNAESNASKDTGIGYADSADGLVSLPANTVELKYMLYGHTSLTGSVGFTDFMRMTQHYTTTTGAKWSQGDFNYDGAVDSNDFNLLKPNYGQTLPVPVPAPVPATARMPTSVNPVQAVAGGPSTANPAGSNEATGALRDGASSGGPKRKVRKSVKAQKTHR